MKVYKALVAAGLCVCMALGMTGCGNDALDGSQIVAAVGEKEMTLGEANFLLRYQQVQTESYYESLVGEGFYDMDLYGDGTTYSQVFKEDVMDQMQEYYILEEKAADYGIVLTDEETAAITEAAEAFLDANEKATKEQMTADQATVERVLTLMTIGTKVSAKVKEEAAVTVTDEEAAQRAFTYITISKGSDDSALTDEEIQEKKEILAGVAEQVKAGNEMEGAAVEAELTAYPVTYGEGNSDYYAAELISAVDALKEGEVTEVIETDSALYLAQLTSEFDEEATESRKETLKTTKENEYYNGVLETWKEEYPLTVVDSVWEKVVFNRSYDAAQ
ncbi:MAG: SurA N-terminal domain-containing protein [Lachnospiraceae bacterium]|nr:SurA N-terminal domain-containing protein [Lachnospiraceae bacterium]